MLALGLGACFAAGLAACSAAGNATSPGPSPADASSLAPSLPVATVRQVHVSISDAGCSPQALQLPAGPTTFIVTNVGSGSVLEYEIIKADRVIGETENVIPGIDRSFTLNLNGLSTFS